MSARRMRAKLSCEIIQWSHPALRENALSIFSISVSLALRSMENRIQNHSSWLLAIGHTNEDLWLSVYHDAEGRDTDQPPQALTFALVNPPAGATVLPREAGTLGRTEWRPEVFWPVSLASASPFSLVSFPPALLDMALVLSAKRPCLTESPPHASGSQARCRGGP